MEVIHATAPPTRADGHRAPNGRRRGVVLVPIFSRARFYLNNKSIQGIASMVDIKQEKLGRFVRESA